MSTSTSRMQSRMSTSASRMQSRMSTSRLQYLSDDEDEEAMEEERSFKPKVAIEISKKRYLINRPVSFNDQVIYLVCCLKNQKRNIEGSVNNGGGDAV